MPVACGLLLSSRPLGTLQWSKGEIRIQSSGSSTQITTTSRCSGEIAEASFCKGRHNQLRNRMARPDRPVRLQVLLKRYSPECVEGEFCEVRLYGVLGSSWVRGRSTPSGPALCLGGAQLAGSADERLVARRSLAVRTAQRVLEADAGVEALAHRIP